MTSRLLEDLLTLEFPCCLTHVYLHVCSNSTLKINPGVRGALKITDLCCCCMFV